MIARAMAVRRVLVGGAAGMLAIVAARGVLHAHATLLSSEPAAGSVLARSPQRIRLVFSEAVDASVSSMRLASPNLAPRDLIVRADPRDVSAIIALLDVLPAGAYKVTWRTMSADGHRVDGTLAFTVSPDTSTAPVAKPPSAPIVSVPAADSVSTGGILFGAPPIPALLRGLALGSLLAFGGLLFFCRRPTANVARASRVSLWLGVAAQAFLIAHLIAWSVDASPDRRFAGSWLRSMLGTGPGHMELIRIAGVALALWAIVLARRLTLALAFAVLAVAVSGGIGHPAALHPVVTIPAKAIHLCAGAAWLGGLLWLIVVDRSDVERFAAEARRVSKVALISVTLVVLSGVVQTALFLESPSDLVRSAYGKIVLLKVAGVLILIAFGAYHRKSLQPTVSASDLAIRLRNSVGFEISVFLLTVLLGGLLAYIPPQLP